MCVCVCVCVCWPVKPASGLRNVYFHVKFYGQDIIGK